MTINRMSGARIRRRIRKIVVDAWAADAAATRSETRRARGPPSSRANTRVPTVRGEVSTTASCHPRWNDTVSTTSSTTETTLASSAPPERETTLAVQASFRPAEETYVA
jgi:hypothetical protein